MDLTANVPRDLWDLIPDFLLHRREEVEQLRAALSAGDREVLTHLAERMYALGNPYGFRQITTYGRQMRDALAGGKIGTVRRLIRQYAEYLDKVELVQVENPVMRSIWRERAEERRIAEASALPPPGVPERRKRQRRRAVATRDHASPGAAPPAFGRGRDSE